MFCPAARVFIKDLKALENKTTRFSIDMQVLKDLKSRFFKSGFAAAREIILQILIQTTRGMARDRPSPYGHPGMARDRPSPYVKGRRFFSP